MDEKKFYQTDQSVGLRRDPCTSEYKATNNLGDIIKSIKEQLVPYRTEASATVYCAT